MCLSHLFAIDQNFCLRGVLYLVKFSPNDLSSLATDYKINREHANVLISLSPPHSTSPPR